MARYRRIHEGKKHPKHVPNGERHMIYALVDHLTSGKQAARGASALARLHLYRHLDGTARQAS